MQLDPPIRNKDNNQIPKLLLKNAPPSPEKDPNEWATTPREYTNNDNTNLTFVEKIFKIIKTMPCIKK